METKTKTPQRKLKSEFNQIINAIEVRAMANDGPVLPTLKCATEQELSRLWQLINGIELQSNWIKSSKKKPDCNVSVFVFIPEEDFHITTGMWDVSKKWVLLDEYRVPRSEVTYWRPMIDAPSDHSYKKTEFVDEEETMSSQISKLQKELYHAQSELEQTKSELALSQKNLTDTANVYQPIFNWAMNEGQGLKIEAAVKEVLRRANVYEQQKAENYALAFEAQLKKTFNGSEYDPAKELDSLKQENERLKTLNSELLNALVDARKTFEHKAGFYKPLVTKMDLAISKAK